MGGAVLPRLLLFCDGCKRYSYSYCRPTLRPIGTTTDTATATTTTTAIATAADADAATATLALLLPLPPPLPLPQMLLFGLLILVHVLQSVPLPCRNCIFNLCG